MSRHYKSADLRGKTVLITGASSGFGEAIAWRCAELGGKLILLARRKERLEILQSEITAEYPDVEINLVVMDVRNTEEVQSLPSSLPPAFREVDILINNAGLALGTDPVQSNSIEDIKTMLDTNVLAVAVFTKVFTPGMVAKNSGHIVNIGSTAGHESYAGGSMYCASKHALRAFTNAARDDLVGTDIRVTLISPGAAETEFSIVRFKGDVDKAANVYKGFAAMNAADVADQIVFAITRPPHVQINDIIVTSVHQSGARTIARPLQNKTIIMQSASSAAASGLRNLALRSQCWGGSKNTWAVRGSSGRRILKGKQISAILVKQCYAARWTVVLGRHKC
ncbi:hypothetical protein CEUSTIGMA_g11107.t1 [Chlamydomonas eustigma]|uniref:Uncharacterized protein n=1 Tax=Chlamydomonas eustigma TaxID=1157962 RepID=A0A250XLB5_9CHLO|nr:hypothetical protein CEUSTIGMA_g11107.t1 [Chlamydomonas eustigma]|eukprot:GAX83682.1 hypothetical protein CEUSTIGMA_g11107.t1 [Chlamydomonas eustigma]